MAADISKIRGRALFLIALYDLVLGSVAAGLLWLMLSTEVTARSPLSENIYLCGLTMVGAVLGGVIRCFQGIHKYGLINDIFGTRHIGSYLLGPLAAAFLGLAVFVFVHGGIFLLTGPKTTQDTQMPALTHLALGIASGFAWEQILTKMAHGVKNLLGVASVDTHGKGAAPPEQTGHQTSDSAIDQEAPRDGTAE